MKLSKFMLPAAVAAMLASASASADYSRQEIEKIVHDYLVEHPEVLIEAGKNLQKKQAELAVEQEQQYLKDYQQELFNSPYDAQVGPKTAKNVIVEFSDYNCGYCKRSKKLFFEVLKAHEAKGDVRYIFKEYPILGAGSEIAARASLAVYSLYPDKFLDYHMAVISGSKVSSDADLKPHAEKLGMDWKAIKEKMASSQVSDVISKNQNLGMAMEVTGTPCYIINGKFVRGAPQTVDYIESQLAK